MSTLRKFFVVLLALTALVVVAAYATYEMTPEHRARRVAARWQRLVDEFFVENPEAEIRKEYYKRRSTRFVDELREIACRCELPGELSQVGHRGELPLFGHAVIGQHKWDECLYWKLVSEVLRHWLERWTIKRRALEEPHQ